MGADELEGVWVDDAVVISSIIESIADHVVTALRICATNSILSDGILDDATSLLAYCDHVEGAWRARQD